MKLFRFGAGHFQVFVTHELRPAKTEGAVGVAGLALGREEQHCLAILVLNAVQNFTVELRHVHFHLASRVRVEFVPDFLGDSLDLFLVGTFPVQFRHALVMLVLQHPFLRKNKLIDRVVGYLVPVDQFIDHILVDPERQHAGYHFHFKQGLFREILNDFDLVELAVCVDLETPFLELRSGNPVRKGDDGVHRSPSVDANDKKVVRPLFPGWLKIRQASIHKSGNIFRSNKKAEIDQWGASEERVENSIKSAKYSE